MTNMMLITNIKRTWTIDLEKKIQDPVQVLIPEEILLKPSIMKILSQVLASCQWTFALSDKILKKIEIGKNITIAWKSIPRLLKLRSLVVKCCKL